MMDDDSLFDDMNSIYENRDVLSEDYQPDTLLEREEEKQEYGSALSPILYGNSPNNVFLYGNTGVGKTAVTRFMFDHLRDQLEENDVDVDLTVIWQNCRNETSSYQVATSLVNRMRPTGEEMAETGHPASTVYKNLFEEIENIGGTVLIVLDEVDAIGDDDGLLYELPRAKDLGKVEDANVGVVGISNDYQFREQLSPQVQDTLCEKEITFPAYDANELRTILESRVEKGFNDGVVKKGAIHLAAALAAKDSGSARQALDLLQEAGDMAAERGSDVTDDLVEEAVQMIDRADVKESISDLTMHAQLTLAAVTFVSEREKEPRTKAIYNFYERLCGHNGTDALSYRSFQNRLNDLTMMGFATQDEINKGEGGGRTYTFWTEHDLELVVDALEDLDIPERL